MASRGATQEAMATAVGLSIKTLSRIYADEIGRAAELIRQAVFATQVRLAVNKGSTPAARFVLAELEKVEAARIAYRAPAPAKLGKKEERQAAAKQVAGIFAPGEAPALLTSH